MKRFVTYLYEYERGMKTKNVGFIRVDIRGSIVILEVSVRKLRTEDEKGIICGLVDQNGLRSVELGELRVFGGQGDVRLQLQASKLQGTSLSMDDVIGIGISFPDDTYIASCWVDEYAEQIAKKVYPSFEESVEEEVLQEDVQQHEVDMSLSSEIVAAQVEKVDKEEKKDEQQMLTTQYCYRKLELTHMHMLPMQDRHYSSNAFLVHGFWNYGYVVLKTEIKGDEKKTWLGVPGVYERPEAAMALAFGFPLFEAVPTEVVEAPLNIERCFTEESIRERNFQQRPANGTLKNQPSKDKLFGCWFVELHM